MTDWAYTAWKEYRDWYEKLVVECDQKSGGKYLTYMLDTLRKELKKTWKDRMSYLRGAIEDEDIVQSFQPLQERGRIGFGTYDPSQTVAPPMTMTMRVKWIWMNGQMMTMKNEG